MTEDDAWLVSEVEIWSITNPVSDLFCLDVEHNHPDGVVSLVRRLSLILDAWRTDWNVQFHINGNIDKYPCELVGLQYHFAKFYLYSHMVRRAVVAKSGPSQLEPDLEEFTNAAIHSAMSIIQVILADKEIQSYFHRLPIYFDDMIALAFVFLLRMTIKSPVSAWIDKVEISVSLNNLVKVLENITAGMHPRHSLAGITSSMQRLVDRLCPMAQRFGEVK